MNEHSVLYPVNCNQFLDWDENPLEGGSATTCLYQSLVATKKFLSSLDITLGEKAARFLESVSRRDTASPDVFLNDPGLSADESSRQFMESIMTLIASANRRLSTAAMRVLQTVIYKLSPKPRLTFVQADTIPQLLAILNPTSLSFVQTVGIHAGILSIIESSLYLSSIVDDLGTRLK
ncbi:hypothetical protein BLNAU_13745 [Blattamonas nauphoetae]|uniref:Uncharacterized protein n=1 Tax=Blattamonas nauphoetae TaxID=2049346 RepID=A0ABQ9XFX3_9EUKA|nr:hypothetical protein BLNAU_13745 [Blattamonas nauphoetae]